MDDAAAVDEGFGDGGDGFYDAGGAEEEEGAEAGHEEGYSGEGVGDPGCEADRGGEDVVLD